ncbi:hypothetical protein, partial [Scytonema sp. PCC 10023]|uniref:hypothetical protein n=1 Tax=Scytonema sp. PCC 10023 TaxID=1680591 RepID=UPI0039C5E78E
AQNDPYCWSKRFLLLAPTSTLLLISSLEKAIAFWHCALVPKGHARERSRNRPNGTGTIMRSPSLRRAQSPCRAVRDRSQAGTLCHRTIVPAVSGSMYYRV